MKPRMARIDTNEIDRGYLQEIRVHSCNSWFHSPFFVVFVSFVVIYLHFYQEIE